jgi:hypothetical protein
MLRLIGQGKGPKIQKRLLSKTLPYTKTSLIFVSASFYKQGVCHTVALPFTLKNILRKEKTYGNSNITMQTYNLEKIL